MHINNLFGENYEDNQKIEDFLDEDYKDHFSEDTIKYFIAREKIDNTFEEIAAKFYFNLCRTVIWYSSIKEKEYCAYAGQIIFCDENEKFNFTVPFKVYVYKKKTKLWFPIPINLIEKKIEEYYLDTLDFDEKIEYYSKKKGNK